MMFILKKERKDNEKKIRERCMYNKYNKYEDLKKYK